MLNRYFGFRKWPYMLPLIGETTGHIELFLNTKRGGLHCLALSIPSMPARQEAPAFRSARTSDLLGMWLSPTLCV